MCVRVVRGVRVGARRVGARGGVCGARARATAPAAVGYTLNPDLGFRMGGWMTTPLAWDRE